MFHNTNTLLKRSCWQITKCDEAVEGVPRAWTVECRKHIYLRVNNRGSFLQRQRLQDYQKLKQFSDWVCFSFFFLFFFFMISSNYKIAIHQLNFFILLLQILQTYSCLKLKIIFFFLLSAVLLNVLNRINMDARVP